jgi:hypothetical protein
MEMIADFVCVLNHYSLYQYSYNLLYIWKQIQSLKISNN